MQLVQLMLMLSPKLILKLNLKQLMQMLNLMV